MSTWCAFAPSSDPSPHGRGKRLPRTAPPAQCLPGGNSATIRIKKQDHSYREIVNPHLQVLIKQLEDMPLDGGFRRVVNCLVDAGGRDLDFVDPPLEESGSTHPAVRVNVATRKFTGTVEIFYKAMGDLYGIRLREQGLETDTVLDNIGFEELGEAIQDAIDDGSWQLARVTVLRRAKAASSVPA